MKPPKPARGGRRTGAGRPVTSGKGEILPWRFPPGTLARVSALAAQHGVPSGTLVREILRAYLEEDGPRE